MKDEELVGRKYLNDIGLPGGIPEDEDAPKEKVAKRKLERAIYGFDERDTWSLDITMIELLYERVSHYVKIADDKIDLTNHKMTYKGQTKNQKEWIIEIIELCEWYLKVGYHAENYEESYEKGTRLWGIWSEIHQAMWW